MSMEFSALSLQFPINNRQASARRLSVFIGDSAGHQTEIRYITLVHRNDLHGGMESAIFYARVLLE